MRVIVQGFLANYLRRFFHVERFLNHLIDDGLNLLKNKKMKLTKKQTKLIGHILGFADLGQTPTHKELASLVGTTSTAVTIMLRSLNAKGAVVVNRKWRGVVVTAQGLQAWQANKEVQ